MPKKKDGNPVVGLLSLTVIAIILFSWFSNATKSPDKRAAENAESTEKKRKGFHCLSAWDGSHQKFVEALKSQLREPESFEHIETRVAPVSDDGTHSLTMEYRARNGFGGMNVGTAMGVYRNSDCNATILSVE